jgi:hypothetical protein
MENNGKMTVLMNPFAVDKSFPVAFMVDDVNL